MSYYNDFQASLFAFCKAVAAQYNMKVFKFDASTQIHEMPAEDVIGVAEFTIESDGLDVGHAMIMVSTVDDKNLDRMDAVIGDLYQRLMPSKKIPFVLASNGQHRGLLTVMEGTKVLPVAKTSTRPLKAVAVRLGADRPQSP